MEETTAAVYPQRATAPALPVTAEHTIPGPDAFRCGEQVQFVRPTIMSAFTSSDTTVRLSYATAGFINNTTQTHETRLHQFLVDPAPTPPVIVEITFWSEACFRVRIGHDLPPVTNGPLADARGHMLVGTPALHITMQVSKTATTVDITTPVLTLRLDRTSYGIIANDAQGQRFWEVQRPELFTADMLTTAVAHLQDRVGCYDAFALLPGEAIFGLGERFDAVERRGRVVDFWNKDAIGTSSRRSYLNVPFLWTTRGYGLFVNATARTEWDIGVSDGGTLGFAVEDPVLDYFIIYGPEPATILQRYSHLTGFAPTPPIWSFGLWMSRNSYVNWDVVQDVADELRKREIPCDVLHLDTAWFAEDWNCDLRFSAERFPDPAAHLAALREQGYRVSLWQYNFIPPHANNVNYQEARAQGYLATGPAGEPFTYPPGTTGSWVDDAIIDFSNPPACDWYAAQIRALIALGAATIKTDFGEGIPETAHFHGIDGAHFHNGYALLYNAVVAEAVHAVSGDHIIWARSGTAGSQRYPIHWGGDSQATWNGLAGTLRGGLSLGLSGFPYFSHDIGGFIGRPDPELYIRWAQMGLFTSHARCHGAGNDNSREPWSFGPEAERIFRRYDELRYRLLPYIYAQAVASATTAKPLMRALVIDYPSDRNVWHIDDQYLFGDAFLVAPILQPQAVAATRTLYLPQGTWFDYWTKAPIVSRGEWITCPVDLASLPLYVKADTVLPYTTLRPHTGNEVGPITRLEVYGELPTAWHFAAGEHDLTLSLTAGTPQVMGDLPVPTVAVFPTVTPTGD